MKRLTAIFSLTCLFLLPFVSPYLFDKGNILVRNHPTKIVQFETHQQAHVTPSKPSDHSEAHVQAFNQRVEHYFDELALSDNALLALVIVMTLSILTLLLHPLIAYLATCHQPTPKKQPIVDKPHHQIAAYKHHLLS